MQYCISCGQENKLSAVKCISCGADLKNLDEIVLPKTQNRADVFVNKPRESANRVNQILASCDLESLAEEFLGEMQNDPKFPRDSQKMIDGDELIGEIKTKKTRRTR